MLRRFLFKISFCLFAVPTLLAQTKPVITSSLNDGSTVIYGKGQLKDGATYKAVSIWACSGVAPAVSATPGTLADCATKLLLTNAPDPNSPNQIPIDENGNFNLSLKNKMSTGTQVWVMQQISPATAGAAASAPIASDGVVVGAALNKVTLRTPVKDNQNPIVGTATPSTTAVPVQVQLWVAPTAGGTFSAQGDPELVATDGNYTLHETVTQGESITVRQLGANAQQSDAVTVVPADNGREHIDFFAGTIISQGESNFGQADTFLALNVDRALMNPVKYPLSGKRPGLNTFFQARLTTIPVNSSTSTTTSTTSTTTAATIPSFSSVLSSQKTGHFEAGVYLPWIIGNTPTQDAKTQTFYLAPLARFGFNTLAGNTQTNTACQTSATTSSCPSGSTSVTTVTALGTTDPLPSAYNFFVLGGRIGTAKLEPESLHNVHYLDIGLGKFSNLENLACSAGMGQCVGVASENRYRPWRLSFEGYYELPNTGFIVGMSANVGVGALDRRANTDIKNRAASDLRFTFGYKFDAVKLFKQLPMLQ